MKTESVMKLNMKGNIKKNKGQKLIGELIKPILWHFDLIREKKKQASEQAIDQR